MRRQQPLWLSLGPSSSQVFFLHRHLPSAPLWISEWLQGSLQILRGGTSAIWPGFGSENFSHMAGVWTKLDRYMTLLCSKVLKFQRCSETDSVLVLRTQGEAAEPPPSSPPGRRRPRRRAVAVLAAEPSPSSPPRTSRHPCPELARRYFGSA